MRVFLVRPNSALKATTLPLGLGYVADAARKAGHKVSLLDARLARLSAEQTAQRIKAAAPEVIGISAIHFEKQGALELAEAVKSAGVEAPVALGGPLVSTAGADLVRSGAVSAAIMGEGEAAFVSYLEALSGTRPLSEAPGLIYRENDELKANPVGPFLDDLDDRLPAWDLIEPRRYFKTFGRSTLNMLRRSSHTASIFTSRGCPFGCLYCHNTFGRKFRGRSPEAVLSEIEMLVRVHGVRELEIVDDAFNVNLDRAKEIARLLIESRLKLSISFSNGLRADRMDEELLELLRRAGTYRINYAIETASPRLQKLIHKNLDLEKTAGVIELTANKGIFMLGYFMLGFPTETEAEMMATVDYALRSKLHAAGFFYVTPFPGTELAEKFPAPEAALMAVDRHDYTKMAVNLSPVPDERLKEIFRMAYRRFHFAPGRMWRTFKVAPKNLRTLWSVIVIAILSRRDYGNF